MLQQARAGLFPSTHARRRPTSGASPATTSCWPRWPNQPARGGWFATGAFNVSYEVDLFGRIRRSIEAARADAAADRGSRERGAHHRRRRDRARLRRRLRLRRAGRHRPPERRRSPSRCWTSPPAQRDLGAKSDFDVASAAAVLDQTRATIPTFEGERRAQLFELAVLTGRPPARDLRRPRPPASRRRTIATPLPVGDGAALLRRRPDVREAERTLAGRHRADRRRRPPTSSPPSR